MFPRCHIPLALLPSQEMAVCEKFSLKWNDFPTNLSSSFDGLRQEQEFTDVSLVCEDGKALPAHRVILASGSDFFRSLLKGSSHPHPLVYLRGVETKHLTSVVDFIYQGEVNVPQDDLNDFLAVAEDLKLKGLIPDKTPTQETIAKPETNQKKKTAKTPKHAEEDKKIMFVGSLSLSDQFDVDNTPKNNSSLVSADHTLDYSHEGMTIMEPKTSVSYKEDKILDERINRMLHRMDGAYRCTECGKTDSRKVMMKMHIETHITDVLHPCGYCSKMFRSRNSLKFHLGKTCNPLFFS